MEYLRKYPKPNEKLYHLTSGECIDQILKDGLKANADGEIFLFQDKTITSPYFGDITVYDNILRNEIFLDINRDEIFECEVDQKGIKGKLIPDDCTELTSGFQWICKQDVIERKYIKIRQVESLY